MSSDSGTMARPSACSVASVNGNRCVKDMLQHFSPCAPGAGTVASASLPDEEL